MESISLDSDESSHRRGIHNSLPRHLPHCLLIAQVQEVVSGEWDVCDNWLAPSHDPVMMFQPDKPGSWYEGNVDAGYPPGGRQMNDFFFIAFHFAAELFPSSYSPCPHIQQGE